MITLPSALEVSDNQSHATVSYLGLQLDEHTPAAIAMPQAREVLEISSQSISLLPNLPPYLLGVLNQRSRIYWVVDLAQVLGLTRLKTDQSRYNLAIVKSGMMTLALAVYNIQGVIRCNPEAIQSPLSGMASDLAPYLQGCLLRQQQIVYILEPQAIAKALWLNQGQS